MRISGLLIFLSLQGLGLKAQTTNDSVVNFWSQVTPAKQHPADPQKIEQLTRWCQQQLPPVNLPCPADPVWNNLSDPQNALYPALQSQLTATLACNEQQLRSLALRTRIVRDVQYVSGLILRAFFHVSHSEYSTARTYAEQAGRLADSLQVLQGWAKLVQARALFGQETNFSQTYSLINQALDLARQQSDPYLEAYALSTLGMINRRIYFGASLKAIPYHQAALRIGVAKRDTMLIAQETLALALNYDDAGRLDKSVDYMLRLIPLVNHRNLPRIRARLFIMASRLLPSRQVTQQEALIRKGLQCSILTGETFHVEYVYQDLYELLIANNRPEEATQVVYRLDSLNQIMAPHRSYNASTNLLWYQLAKRKGDKTNALTYLEKEYQAISQRYQTQNAAALSQWEAIFHTEEQDILLKQREQQYVYLIIVIGLVTLLLLTAGVALYFQSKSQRAIRRQIVMTEAQAGQLRQIDMLKSQFFANVSHELRTPLTLILGPLGSLLKQRLADDRSGELLKTAQQNARRLLGLVNEIMDLTKLEAGKLEVTSDPVNLYALMNRIVANFKSLAHQAAIELQLIVEMDTALLVELDASKYQKILDNLLMNAFKFTPPNGHITVYVSERPALIHVEVTDTGRGIYPNDLPYVFDRYFQTRQPGAPSEGGTGIGLALSAELAKLLGGQLWVKSQWQQGTTFYLEIPKRIVEPDDARFASVEDADKTDTLSAVSLPRPLPIHADGKTSLMLVEDDVHLRHYLTTILQPAYTVLSTQHGQEALDHLTASSALPSLIISDLMMPVMDGFGLLEALKRTDAYRHIPVIMLTARADKVDKLQALRLGVDDYLLKPFDEDELIARVTNLLAHSMERQLRTPLSVAVTDELEQAPIMSSVDINWLERLERYTREKLGQFDLTADQLAETLAVSRSTLFREIKRLTGLTPAQYITEARLQQARWLLENRRVASVKEVAQQVGLRQVKHFSLTFKNRFGKLPSEYL